MKKIYINCSEQQGSTDLKSSLEKLLEKHGFELAPPDDPALDFAISIGGDGTFLRTVRAIEYQDKPVIGINTGHLGFFSELSPEESGKLLEILNGNYSVQRYRTIKTRIKSGSESFELSPALNDVSVRHWYSSLIHLKISIGDSLIENFSGDGVLIASSAGSTAYNYSLGGSIVDPRLALLQLTPIAPANNKVYRSFTSSIVLPPQHEIILKPQDHKDAMIIIDGSENSFADIEEVSVSLSENELQIVRLPGYDFWAKVKSKFL